MTSHCVREYGAVGDGEADDTDAIQAAIDDCGDAGGGTVTLPAGTYRSMPLFLRSEIELHLEAGATLRAIEEPRTYPTVRGRWNGIEGEVYASLLTGHDLTNVAITGRGTIDARGQPWWDLVAENHEVFRDRGYGRMDCYPAPPEAPLTYPRPNAVHLQSCENVLIRDVTVRNSPFWAIHPVYCQDVTVDAVTVENPPDSPNTDGINPDSCRNVHIANCHVDVGDDCITIKSGFDEDGRRVDHPCENVTVTNCTMYHGHGGVVIGSEMSGDVRNVAISNCVFDGTDNGLRIKTERGRGGVVEDIRAANIVMRNVGNIAVLINMQYHGADEDEVPVTEATPTLRDIHVSDVSVRAADTLAAIRGLPESPVTGVTLTDVRAHEVRRGFDASRLSDLYLRNLIADATATPAVRIEDATRVELDRVGAPRALEDEPIIQLREAAATVRHCTASDGTTVFLEHGPESTVRLADNNLAAAAEPVAQPGD